MHITNIHEAKTHLSQLLQEVIEGEEVVIAKAGVPIAKIVPYKIKVKERKPGYLRGKIKIAEDFDTLPQDILNTFYGENE